MKSIRIWFKKVDTAKFISHLDLCRCMERAIHKAKLPFWYTQGYNPHVFLTITMPISLGYTGLQESMDVKLLEDEMPFEAIIEQLNAGLPNDIQVFEITEQLMKPGDFAYSDYELIFDEDVKSLSEEVRRLLEEETIPVMKRTKKGEKEMDIKPFFEKMQIDASQSDKLILRVVLPSNNSGSVNPSLFVGALSAACGKELFPQTTRLACYNEQMEAFR